MTGNVQPCPLHFAADGFALKCEQLVTVVLVIDQLVASQDDPRPDCRAPPLV